MIYDLWSDDCGRRSCECFVAEAYFSSRAWLQNLIQALVLAAHLLQTHTHTHTHRFFRRYNKALLDKTSIDREKERLEKENADLRCVCVREVHTAHVRDHVYKRVRMWGVRRGWRRRRQTSGTRVYVCASVCASEGEGDACDCLE